MPEAKLTVKVEALPVALLEIDFLGPNHREELKEARINNPNTYRD